MLKVSAVLLREGEKGQFALLELQGDLELVQSSTTGRYYATVRKCTMSCTLDYEAAKGFIGKEMPGSIQKVDCEPYEYTVEETGEVITLNHRWEYVPEKKAPVVGMTLEKQVA